MEALELAVAVSPDSSQVAEIVAMLERVAQVKGHPALGEHKWIDLLDGAKPSGTTDVLPPDHIGILARIGSPPRLVGYAQLSLDRQRRVYAVEMAVEPGASDAPAIADAVLRASIDLVVEGGGGHLRLWVSQASPVDDARAAVHGFRVERNLIQMRCPLPLPDAATGGQQDPVLSNRPFRPGLDEDAWLTTNNRAFASHPEQGHWERATLLEREKEAWFDPDGLLLLEAEGRLAGSCWTKIHGSADPPLGEIYVIGVDPDFRGRGWGRALTRAGLLWLADRGLKVGMLYVDAANVAAISMYRSMGFIEDHVDRAYAMSTPSR